MKISTATRSNDCLRGTAYYGARGESLPGGDDDAAAAAGFSVSQ